MLLGGLFFLILAVQGFAQTATLQGIVTTETDGQPLIGASITLEYIQDGSIWGRAAGSNGFYQFTGLPSGHYTLAISYIGYRAYEDTLSLKAGETHTVSVMLARDEKQLDVLMVTVPGTGAAGLEAGRQRVEAADFRRVPSPSGDLSSYLQTMPGVVSSGDRGGQLFIRGGTPAENMVLMDGVLIFQPFHILGYFSAFPESIVSDADVYAGGFGAAYNGRISSVMDVNMRNGNRYEASGSASVSPFLAEVTAEGPITKGRTSWIASVRRSLVEESSPMFHGERHPLRFESQYLKMTHFGRRDSRCSLMAMRTYDRGRLDLTADDMVRWTNVVAGGRCVVLPENARMLFDANMGISYVSNATGQVDSPELTSDALRVNLDVNLTRFLGNTQLDYGLFLHVNHFSYDMRERFGGPQFASEHMVSTGVYTEATFTIGSFELKPGAVFAFYMQSYKPGIEPRLRASWNPFGRDEEQLTAALGLYRQPVTGVHGTRDAGSVFTAWMMSPTGDSQSEAIHAILGWRQTLVQGLEFSVEGYRKWMNHLSVPEWGHLVQFTTHLSPAEGTVSGWDTRIEFNRGNVYGYAGYGFSVTEYTTSQSHFQEWFGETSRSYHPPHDRRHQINAMVSVELGSYTFGVQWMFGSGLPFTRPMGFDELHGFRDGLPFVKDEFGVQRVILDDFYEGRMLPLHRLDLSAERSFDWNRGQVHIKAGATNLYDRENMFYYDVFTHRRVNQLPLAPYLTLEVSI